MEDYKVYVHINKVNGKRYYGITGEEKVEHRWRRNGKGYPNNEYFTNAINKYGWHNFEHIVIVRGLDKEEADWLEMELIREFDTTNRDKGYNITKGGDGVRGLCGEKHPFYGKNHTEEWKEEHSKRMSGEGNPMFGKNHAKESKKKNREAHLGKNNGRATSVICLTTKKIFHTAIEGAKKYEISRSSDISNCCKGYRILKGKRYKANYCGKLPNGTPLVWRYIVWNHGKVYRIVRNKEVV